MIMADHRMEVHGDNDAKASSQRQIVNLMELLNFNFAISMLFFAAIFLLKNVFPVNFAIMCMWAVILLCCVVSETFILVLEKDQTSFSQTIPEVKEIQTLIEENRNIMQSNIWTVGSFAIRAFGMTASTCAVIAFISLQSTWDLSNLSPGLNLAFWMFLSWCFYSSVGRSQKIGPSCSIVGIVFFSLYTAVDVQKMMNPSTDDNVIASMRVFLDVLILFLQTLQFFTSSARTRLKNRDLGQSQHVVSPLALPEADDMA